jgi:hypothetical protein
LCEATCGLTLTIDDGRLTGARGDRDDVFSHGFICPKGASFAELDNDPDRLARPLVRRDGVLTKATWDEAFAAVAEGLNAVIAEHGGTSVGVYLGNPSAHTVAGALYPPVIIRALGTRQVFSASTLDQMPKHVALGLMFGSPVAFTVPDLDRTDYLVVIGANPLVSNGSLATAADFPGRLRALRKRGGTLVVIDPARTRTAELADRHIAVRPGTDPALMLAIVHVLFDEGLVDLGTVADHVNGLEEVRAVAADFGPDTVAEYCGVAADEILVLARELAAAPTAAVYGRIGTSTVEFGTLGSWLVDVINVLTGNLDRPGGAMFPLGATAPAPRPPKTGRGFRIGRWHSRVSGYPEALSEFPAAALAEEIDTAGDRPLRLRAQQPGRAQQCPVFPAGAARGRSTRRGGDPVADRARPLRFRRRRRSRCRRRTSHRDGIGQGDRRSWLAGCRPSRCRTDRDARTRPRVRAPPRHDAAAGGVRRRVRRQARRSDIAATQRDAARC